MKLSLYNQIHTECLHGIINLYIWLENSFNLCTNFHHNMECFVLVSRSQKILQDILYSSFFDFHIWYTSSYNPASVLQQPAYICFLWSLYQWILPGVIHECSVVSSTRYVLKCCHRFLDYSMWWHPFYLYRDMAIYFRFWRGTDNWYSNEYTRMFFRCTAVSFSFPNKENNKTKRART